MFRTCSYLDSHTESRYNNDNQNRSGLAYYYYGHPACGRHTNDAERFRGAGQRASLLYKLEYSLIRAVSGRVGRHSAGQHSAD